MQPIDQLRLAATVVELPEHRPHALCDEVLDRYVEHFGERVRAGRPFYHRDDWRRISYTFEVMQRGGDVLDVGLGAGEFFNLLAMSGEFSSVKGVDRIRFKRFLQLDDRAERFEASIAELPFPDDSFDVVTCMEVLEHVADSDFEQGLRELRRVCRGQLLMTVPYREPEPIYESHVRRFEDVDLLRCFPDGSFTLLNRKQVPWMLIEERLDGSRPDPAIDQAGVRALQRRVRRLERDNRALKSRRAVRAADRAGSIARRLRSRLPGRG